jgi:hypothetical protein
VSSSARLICLLVGHMGEKTEAMDGNNVRIGQWEFDCIISGREPACRPRTDGAADSFCAGLEALVELLGQEEPVT